MRFAYLPIFIFPAFRFLGSFEFDELTRAPYPENELKKLFQLCLDQAVNGAKEMGLKPDHFIFILHSRIFDYQLGVHFKELNNTTVEMLLNQFEKVDQSNMAKDRDSAITKDFQIDVTAIQTKGTKSNNNLKRKHPGAARPSKRDQPLHFKVNPQGLHQINNNDDNYCLFLAIVMVVAQNVLPQQRFSEFRRDEEMQMDEVRRIFNATGLDPQEEDYDIEECGDIIQRDFLDRFYPGKFRIFAFDNAGRFKPFFKSEVEDYNTALPIFYWCEDRHYDGIRSMRLLYDKSSRFNYCFSVKKYLFIF